MLLVADLDRLYWRIKKDESNNKFIAKAFWDSAKNGSQGQWTNGWGTKARFPEEVITLEEADSRLADYLSNIAIKGVMDIFGDFLDNCNDVRQEALINMCYNLGEEGLAKFHHFVAEIKKPDTDWKTAARYASESKWYMQVAERAERLCKELETGICFYPDWTKE